MRLYELRPHHRRRHRKKLRLAEFAELGFPLYGEAPAGWDGQDPDPLRAFLDYQGWSWDGERRPLDGFVGRFGGGSLTEVDRTLMCEWLRQQGAGSVQVGPLQDRWGWITATTP
jgi:uncharacterized protein YggL (DUF469 family)